VLVAGEQRALEAGAIGRACVERAGDEQQLLADGLLELEP